MILSSKKDIIAKNISILLIHQLNLTFIPNTKKLSIQNFYSFFLTKKESSSK
jgi:hypothetical protein